ncbi:GNAT family N-acetyltransferase [Pseudoduganella plicata]|uniref:Acetyltransferase n=1 Tax=Pseudoduganella plicata TaxID=321984 RepID=A0A4P7BDR4_9BURK|nr:GNAT family N-acetyltransferase [Pseudoduganella plicata]QBQ35635.1 GNAT family N-acetyltransferase [Pseudoduganella plicata]GGY96412.1 acetyltransferase [Pseudoduganella plicata]
MKIEVRRAQLSERLIVRNLMELYQHDFSELDGTDLDDHGQYGYYDLDCFWINPAWSAYVIKVDDKWAGFALTNDEVHTPGSTCAIMEFFLVRKYRGRGVGRMAAREIMAQCPARWEVRVIHENRVAQDFWTSLLKTAWPTSYQRTIVKNEEWHGPIFSVDTRPATLVGEL